MTVKEIVSRISLNPETGCWEWYGGLDGKGYGQVYINGKNRRVHRVIYECFKGYIQDQELDHVCRVKICCNPQHLEVVTRSENMLRVPRNTHCGKGHSFAEVGFYPGSKGSGRICKRCHSEYYAKKNK